MNACIYAPAPCSWVGSTCVHLHMHVFMNHILPLSPVYYLLHDLASYQKGNKNEAGIVVMHTQIAPPPPPTILIEGRGRAVTLGGFSTYSLNSNNHNKNPKPPLIDEKRKEWGERRNNLPRPLAATSVAIIIGCFPDLNSASTQSRSPWDLSP